MSKAGQGNKFATVKVRDDVWKGIEIRWSLIPPLHLSCVGSMLPRRGSHCLDRSEGNAFEVVTGRSVTRLQLNSDPLPATNQARGYPPPEMSSIHVTRHLLASSVKGTRVAAAGRTYATKQANQRSLAQKTKS